MANQFKNFKEHPPAEVFAYLAPRVKKLDEVLGQGSHMLIGAYVRDYYLLKAKLGAYRSTQDIDFSVAAAARGDFLQRLERIGKQSGVGPGQSSSQDKSVLCRVMEGGIDVDILPFGELAPNGIFEVGERSWDVTGHLESFRVAELWELDSDAVVKIPPLHCMLGLKIIAWDTRHEMYFDKDAEDFHKLLEAGVRIVGEIIFDSEEGQYCLEKWDYDTQKASVGLLAGQLKEDFKGASLGRCLDVLNDKGKASEFLRAAENRGLLSGKVSETEYRERFECFLKAFLAD